MLTGLGEKTFQEAYGELVAGYEGGRKSRFLNRLRDVLPYGSGADFHTRIETEYLHTIEQARAFDRDNMVVGQALNRVVHNVIRAGITPRPMTGDDVLNVEILERWNDWTADKDQCHLAKDLTLHDIAQLTLRHVLVDGDCAHILISGNGNDDGSMGVIEPIEGHRLRAASTQENVVNGVELDPRTRERVAYWFTKESTDPKTQIKAADSKRWETFDGDGNRRILHVLDPRRFSQTRGISALLPVFNAIGMHDDLQIAHMMQAQMAACYAIIENPSENSAAEPAVSSTGPTEIDTVDAFSQITGTIKPGMRYRAPPGTTLTGFSPNIPNAEFFPHALLILTFIAINLNLPVAVLLLDASKSNFSAWRSAIDQARVGFRDIQDWMISRFYRPVYRWKVRQWFGDRTSEQDEMGNKAFKLMAAEWQLPGWSYIEPLKDALADTQRIAGGLASPTSVLANTGRDFATESTQGTADFGDAIERAKERAKKINENFPEDQEKVSWRELVRLPVTSGATLKLAAVVDDDDGGFTNDDAA